MIKQNDILEKKGYLTLESFLEEDIYTLGFLKENMNNKTSQKELMDEALRIASIFKTECQFNIWSKVFYIFKNWSELKIIASNVFFEELCNFLKYLGINADVIENEEVFTEELKKVFSENYGSINVREYISNYPSEYIVGIFAEIEECEDPADYVKLSWDKKKCNIIFTLNCNKFKNSFIKKYIYSLMRQNINIPQDEIYSFRFDLSAKDNECFVYVNGRQYSYKHIGMQCIEQFKERFSRLFLNLSHYTVYEFQQKVLGEDFKKLNCQDIVEWKRLERISQMEQML